MFLRIILFFITNLFILVTISIVLSVLGIQPYITSAGLNYWNLMAFCFVYGMIGALFSLAISRISAKWLMGVKVIEPNAAGDLGWLVQSVYNISRSAGLSTMPQVGVYQSPDVNAFATGPTKKRSLVAVSTGLLQSMRRDEIEGVLAHEVAHIQNGDMVTMTLIQGVVNAFIMFFARIIAYAVSQSVKENMQYLVRMVVTVVLEIAFGVLSMFVTGWFSRQREFRADAGSAKLVGREKMIAALQALKRMHGTGPRETEVHESMAALQIFGKTSNGNPWLSISTHPALDIRIAALQKNS